MKTKQVLVVCGLAFLLMQDGIRAESAGGAEQAVQRFLDSVEAWNGQINAVIQVNGNLLEEARESDRQATALKPLPPLFGVPVLVKDNIETLGMPTSAGSLALAGVPGTRDAPLVSNMKQAGLLIAGKANLSEWANFRSERSSSGWSATGGQARNPHDLGRSPCGSSSGSAVAVAAGMVPLAIGTETNGSIICPAAINGIVGIKPTVGLISRRGVVPISHSQDTAGPMATNVRDAAFLLNALASPDEQDAASPESSLVFERDYSTALRKNGLRGKRIGVVRSLAGYHEGVDERFNQAIEDLQSAGADVVDDLAYPEPPEDMGQFTYDVLLFEFKHDLNRYLASLPEGDHPKNLEALIEFNISHSEQEMKWFRQEIFEKSQAKDGLDSKEYLDALERVQSYHRESIDALLKEHRLDALVSPSNTPAWSIDLIVGDRWLGGSSSYAARAGYPHITVPMGFVHHLPVGLSFVGTAWSELVLIEAAYAYEQATRHARPPAGFGPWFPAVSEDAGQKNPSLGGILGEAFPVPSVVGEGARCEVTEGEEGESQACG